jgi:hypothetical protein
MRERLPAAVAQKIKIRINAERKVSTLSPSGREGDNPR